MLLLVFGLIQVFLLQSRISRLEHLLLEISDRQINKIETEKNPRIGSPNADLEILVFTDFTCPHCLGFYKQLERLRAEFIDSKKVSFVFYSYPMLANPKSRMLAAIGKYGHRIGSYEKFYHVLFAQQDNINERNYVYYFKDLVADTVDFKSVVTNNLQPEIDDDIALIKSHQIKGAPAFIINGKIHVGLKSDDDMIKTLYLELHSN